MSEGPTPIPRRRGPGRPAGGQPGESQEALLQAARALIAEKGLARVTIREVAERAGLQPALVSYYFGSKEGLLRAVVADVAGRTIERVRGGLAGEDDTRQQLSSMLAAAIAGLAEEPYGPRLIVEQVLFGDEQVIDEFAERFAARHMGLFREVLDRGRDEGLFRDLDLKFLLPQIIGGYLFFFLAQPMLQRLFGLEEITPEIAERFAEQAAGVVLHGICVHPGDDA